LLWITIIHGAYFYMMVIVISLRLSTKQANNMIDDKKNTVTQDNQVVSAAYALTLNEKRLLMLAISKVNPLLMPSAMPYLDITAADWLAAYTDSKEPYRDLERASKDLMNRQVHIASRGSSELIQWVDACQYVKGSGGVKLRFGYTLSHYLCGQLEQFTSYPLLEVSRLKSVYSIKLYENLVRFRDTGWRKFTIEGFRELLTPNGEYPEFKALKRDVIDRCINELNAKTNLNVTFEKITKARKVSGLIFRFWEKTQKQKAAMGAIK
jgi:plasmid replication initiation protein